jgi:hypothetical protein
MSRMPAVEWLRLAEEAKPVESYTERVALIARGVPRNVAALTALQYEAASVIGRLAVLVERGGNPVLLEKGVTAVERWNQAVRESEGAFPK